ncbi:hypothetical protein BN1708_007068 [Verticillium longisporum]|uniref:Uncharacterized protein n=1 Tax=Verticillium longisporum TaxID=100787 RepID=A0A0G4MQN8_VERLO|nr:hypothetical protein BN1708_007068 [Verticillium longisporum]
MSVVRHAPSQPATARSMMAAKTRSTHPEMIGRRDVTAEAAGGMITETCRITTSRIDDYDPSIYRLRSPVYQLNAFFINPQSSRHYFSRWNITLMRASSIHHKPRQVLGRELTILTYTGTANPGPVINPRGLGTLSRQRNLSSSLSSVC